MVTHPTFMEMLNSRGAEIVELLREDLKNYGVKDPVIILHSVSMDHMNRDGIRAYVQIQSGGHTVTGSSRGKLANGEVEFVQDEGNSTYETLAGQEEALKLLPAEEVEEALLQSITAADEALMAVLDEERSAPVVQAARRSLHKAQEARRLFLKNI